MSQPPVLHGRDHCPDGPDPIPCLGMTFGEAYKDTNQVIATGNFTKLTTWDNWTVQDATVIDQATNGLQVVKAGYYLMSLMIQWASGAVDHWCTINVDAGTAGVPIDDFSSPIVASGLTNRVVEPTYIAAGSTLDCYVQHTSLANRTLAFAMLKVVRLHPDPPLPYWA